MQDDTERQLGTPVTVATMRLRNRLVATAHASGVVIDGLPVEGDAEYWRRIAAGGASMLISGGTVVAPESTARRRNTVEAWRPAVVDALAPRVEAIHAEGALAVCQLVHLGRETLLAEGYHAPVAPAAVRSPREPTTPRRLAGSEIDEVVEAHRIGTANAVSAGFDGVELHAAHGYLPDQFLSETANPGRDLAGRLQVPLRIAAAMRAAAAGACVGVRVSVEGGAHGGLALTGLCELLPALDRAFDWVNVTVGVRGTYVRDMATERPPLLDAVATLRRHVTRPLLISSAFRDRPDMELALRRGADLIGLARPLIADPQLPRKVLTGRAGAVRPCVSCNEDCRAFDPVLLCSVNPELAPPGHRRRPARPVVLATRSGASGAPRVAVVGAGPAGLECAYRLGRTAGGRVVVFDERPAIGGQLAVAASSPHRRGWQRLLDYYAAALARHGVELRLGAAATPADLEAFDEVVLATGATEVAPEVRGIALARTASAAIAAGTAALAGVEQLVVVDDGFGWWPGVSAVELGVAAGVRQVTVVTPGMAFAAGVPAESRAQLLPRLATSVVHVHGLARLAGVTPAGVELAALSDGTRTQLPADAVIVVGERRARPWPEPMPARAGARAIGDCVVPRRVAHAVAEGFAAADQLLPPR